jgi:predicted 3-demethylubiquinone-9 3-methyltransferase (glyoxalase superfamily)
MNKVTPFLMFNDQLEAALELYVATFPDSRVKNVARAGKDGPVQSAEFTVGGQTFMAYNGGPHFRFSEAFSMFVDCADQAEVDLYWQGLLAAGSRPTRCGWIDDPFGVTWQIVPRRFMEMIADRDPVKVKAVIDAMLAMVKLDVAALEKAYAEAGGKR